MRKALIVQGNPTTTRGLVIGGSAVGMTDDGRPFALYGDEATCGNCKGAFKIVGTATGRCYDGRAGVIEGDLVLCPCGRNRVLAGPNPGCFYEDTDTAVASGAGIASVVTSPYDEQVRATGRGASEGYPYFIETADGRTFSGRLENSGHLPRVYTDGTNEYHVYWGDDALARQEEA
jgi:uncharacterized Zn-binding protein involved in type VI secretion